jgi:hypothetical protein
VSQHERQTIGYPPTRPLISRETRRLFVTIAVSMAALWVLARIRFQERPVTPDPVPPVLAQLLPRSSFDDLASSLADLRPQIAASIVSVEGIGPALRFRDDIAVAMTRRTDKPVLASDGASGLILVRIPQADIAPLTPWSPRRLDYPRYLVATDASGEGVALRPVYVGALQATTSPIWSDVIWALPQSTDLQPGTFVFTTDRAFAGMIVEHDEHRAIVPASTLLRVADRLLEGGDGRQGEIGITVQPVTASVAAATGARSGMVVTSIDPDGPAVGSLNVTDVIEAVAGQDIVTPAHWRARVARLRPGDSITLRVRSNGEVREVQIAAVAAAAEPSELALGLSLRTLGRVGSEVVRVQPRSAAARAGIERGDVITLIGRQQTPSPPQVSRAFAAIPPGASILVAITRGDLRQVVALEKR